MSFAHGHVLHPFPWKGLPLAGGVMRGGESKWGRQMGGGRGFKLLLLATPTNPGLYQRCSMFCPCEGRWGGWMRKRWESSGMRQGIHGAEVRQGLTVPGTVLPPAASQHCQPVLVSLGRGQFSSAFGERGLRRRVCTRAGLAPSGMLGHPWEHGGSVLPLAAPP